MNFVIIILAFISSVSGIVLGIIIRVAIASKRFLNAFFLRWAFVFSNFLAPVLGAINLIGVVANRARSSVMFYLEAILENIDFVYY